MSNKAIKARSRVLKKQRLSNKNLVEKDKSLRQVGSKAPGLLRKRVQWIKARLLSKDQQFRGRRENKLVTTHVESSQDIPSFHNLNSLNTHNRTMSSEMHSSSPSWSSSPMRSHNTCCWTKTLLTLHSVVLSIVIVSVSMLKGTWQDWSRSYSSSLKFKSAFFKRRLSTV